MTFLITQCFFFLQNYSQDFIKTSDFQAQVADIDWLSDVNIYSLSTVGSKYQLSIDKVGIINQADNINGFASTVTSWSRW